MTALLFRMTAPVVLGLSIALSGCGDKQATGSQSSVEVGDLKTLSAQDMADMSPAQLLNVTTDTVKQITDVLSGVNDEASARAAANTLSELGPQFKAMSDRLESIDESDMKMSLSMIQSMSKFATAQVGVVREMGRIADDHPELGQILKDEFENMEF